MKSIDSVLKIQQLKLPKVVPPSVLQMVSFEPFPALEEISTTFISQICPGAGKDNQPTSLLSKFLSCTACKAQSRETLMEINSQSVFQQSKSKEHEQDQEKKSHFKKVYEHRNKRSMKRPICDFQELYKQMGGCNQQRWELEVEKAFGKKV